MRKRLTEPLEKYWSKIYQDCAEENQFLREEWFDSWRVYSNDNNNWSGGVRFGAVTDDEDCAILPYSFQKVGPFNFASVPGLFFPHRGIPYSNASDDLCNNLIDYINNIKGISGFRMGPIDEADPLMNSLLNSFKEKDWKLIIFPVGDNYGLKVPECEEKYMEGLSKRRRKKVAYYLRKIKKEGDVEIRHYGADRKNDWKVIFEDLAKVESNAWVSKWGEPKFMGKPNQEFWSRLVNDEWFSKSINAWIMYLNGKPVSHLVSIDTSGVRYALASSYDEKVSKFRTGGQLEISMMTQAIEKGIKIVNNGLGNSGYKSEWGSEKLSSLIDIIAFPPTFKGHLAYWLAKLKTLAKK